MRSSKNSGNGHEILIEQCAAILRQGIALIESLTDALYAPFEGRERSGVGAHFRHTLDFATNFLSALETGSLDYSRRERDRRIETDRACAARRLGEVVQRIEALNAAKLAKKILVRSETVPDLWCPSFAARELEFLNSHTIHHYALIRTELASKGFIAPPDFGVAPSTLEYWKSRTA